jgi:hypothetical protein
VAAATEFCDYCTIPVFTDFVYKSSYSKEQFSVRPGTICM